MIKNTKSFINLLLSLTLITACETNTSLRSFSLGDLPGELQCLIANPALTVDIMRPESTSMRIWLNNGAEFQNQLVYSGCGDPPTGIASATLDHFSGQVHLNVYHPTTIREPLQIQIQKCDSSSVLSYSDLDFNIHYQSMDACPGLRRGHVSFEEHGVSLPSLN